MFMVAEKPIMANQIAKILARGKKIYFRKGKAYFEERSFRFEWLLSDK